jgi:hypothetical protein
MGLSTSHRSVVGTGSRGAAGGENKQRNIMFARHEVQYETATPSTVDLTSVERVESFAQPEVIASDKLVIAAR